MTSRKHFGFLILAGLLVSALMSGCGGSSDDDNIPTTVDVFNQHSIVFGNGSTVMAAGYNAFGQLGDGTRDNRSAAVQVVSLPAHITGFAAGSAHTLAFANNSSAFAWGFNSHGQLGAASVRTGSSTSTEDFSARPVKVDSISGVTSVAAGAFHSVAVARGKVYGWGLNSNGQLGNGNFSNSNVPVFANISGTVASEPVGSIAATQVAAGSYHSLALVREGAERRVYAWGDNFYGQLGPNGIARISRSVPVLVPLPAGVVQVAAGGRFSLALMEDGTVWAWGYNAFGQLGDAGSMGSEEPRPAPVRVVIYKPADPADPGAPREVLKITKIAAGLAHVVARTEDGGAWAWGFNERGQLGNNPSTGGTASPDSATPVAMLTGGGDEAGSGARVAGVTDVQAFGNSTLVTRRRGDGTLEILGWGDNGFGQLGAPVVKNRPNFYKVPVSMNGI